MTWRSAIIWSFQQWRWLARSACLRRANILKARNKWRENVPGKEWFDTNLKEIEAILKFVSNGN